MNCQSCQKESEEYRGKKLSAEKRTQVGAHLESCKDCANSYITGAIIDSFINREKAIISNPFLATRIMAVLESREKGDMVRKSIFNRVLRPALITTSLAAAIFSGVLLGNVYQAHNKPLPFEISLIDDITIESVDFLSLD